jgi:hypothetical protein
LGWLMRILGSIVAPAQSGFLILILQIRLRTSLRALTNLAH